MQSSAGSATKFLRLENPLFEHMFTLCLLCVYLTRFGRAKRVQLHANNASQYNCIDYNEKFACLFRQRVFRIHATYIKE